MTVSMNQKRFTLPFALAVLLFLSGGTVGGFSQEIIATFGAGVQSLENADKLAGALESGGLLGLNVLFVGRSGLAVSGGIDAFFNIDAGLNADPVFGIGYVYYDAFYVGGVLNWVLKSGTESVINPDFFKGKGTYYYGDVFIAPTLVAGFDFRSFVLGAQVSYVHGCATPVSGFRVIVGAGVNVGRSY
ncbi:MAG: hypothetical protein LBQ14_05515 [Treponema sp.]|jgi:hypothetical protein|nr:hypothetical protein [Treponema sp.]